MKLLAILLDITFGVLAVIGIIVVVLAVWNALADGQITFRSRD